MAFHISSALCCNPFNGSGIIMSEIRNTLPWLAEKLPQLNTDHKVCVCVCLSVCVCACVRACVRQRGRESARVRVKVS
jgi:hypothetical protein